MTDIDALIERLRKASDYDDAFIESVCKDAAAALAELRGDRDDWKAEAEVIDSLLDDAKAEIAKLQGAVEGSVERHTCQMSAAKHEITKLREALEKIAYPPDDIDVPHYPVSIARAALGEKP